MAKYKQECIFGIRAVIEAIQQEKEIDKVMLKQGVRGELFQQLFSLIRERNIPFQYVPEDCLLYTSMVICRYLRYRVGKVFTLGNIPPGNAGFEQAFDLDGEELVFFLDQIGIFGQDAVGDSGCFVEDQGVFTQISHL